MGFQFQCPQGHLLEGEASHAGQQCQCPLCGTLFLIPPPPPTNPPAATVPSIVPQIVVGDQTQAATIYHIPCPTGHELEVPSEMLDQDAICPTCNVQFRLRMKDSVEYQRRKEEEYERRQWKTGQAWLNWAIAAAVIVLAGLAALIAMSM